MPHFGNYDPSSFGWTPDGSQVVGYSYAGASFPQGVHRLVAPLFNGLLADLVHAGLHIPTGPVLTAGNWGYEARDVRGATYLSFHAYGLAIDVDAPHNPMTTAPGYGTMPHNAGALATKWGCEWGGSWSGRRDLMHYECHLAPSEVAGVVAKNSPAKAPSASVALPTLHQGSVGPAVATLQRRLNLTPAVHPAFGPATEAAVRMYQTRHKVSADGVVGPQTWGLLNTSRILPGERVVRLGCTGDDVSWLQRRLWLTPSPHPAFGPITENAVKTWQGRAHLEQTGVVDATTWAKLGANG